MAAAVSAIAAVLGVVVGFLGLPAVLRSPTSKEPTVVTVTVTASPDDESSAGSSPSPGDGPSGSGSSSTKPGPTRTAEFDLVEGYGFDLDATPLRPGKTAGSKNADFYWSTTQELLWASGEKLVDAGETTRDGCLKSTRYSFDISLFDVFVGQTLCVITDDRVALIEVTNTDLGNHNSRFISMKVTSWAKP